MREASPDVFRWLSYSRQGVFLQKGRKLNWYKLSTHNRPIVGSNPTRPTRISQRYQSLTRNAFLCGARRRESGFKLSHLHVVLLPFSHFAYVLKNASTLSQ